MEEDENKVWSTTLEVQTDVKKESNEDDNENKEKYLKKEKSRINLKLKKEKRYAKYNVWKKKEIRCNIKLRTKPLKSSLLDKASKHVR